MKTEIDKRQDELIADFSGFTDWMDRYALIIEMGNDLPDMDEDKKVPQNLIEGCQSRVWIYPQIDDKACIHYQAASDAVIVKGIVAMLLRVMNGLPAKEIANADLYFVKELGLYEHLSPTRSNGLAAMLKQMKLFAIAYTQAQD